MFATRTSGLNSRTTVLFTTVPLELTQLLLHLVLTFVDDVQAEHKATLELQIFHLVGQDVAIGGSMGIHMFVFLLHFPEDLAHSSVMEAVVGQFRQLALLFCVILTLRLSRRDPRAWIPSQHSQTGSQANNSQKHNVTYPRWSLENDGRNRSHKVIQVGETQNRVSLFPVQCPQKSDLHEKARRLDKKTNDLLDSVLSSVLTTARHFMLCTLRKISSVVG